LTTQVIALSSFILSYLSQKTLALLNTPPPIARSAPRTRQPGAPNLDLFPILLTNQGIETFTPPHPAPDLSTSLYYQLVHTLTGLLPPPLDDTQEALRVRNHAAIAKVAALLPVNANEADLAAQCIAARAQAEDLLRLLRRSADNIALVMRLNAQYGSMVRTSLSAHGRLMRVQAVRQKREATDEAATQDAWTQHVAGQSMLSVTDPDAEPLQAPRPKAAPVEAPASRRDQRIADDVSEEGMNSQDAAFETWLIAQTADPGSKGSDETGLRQVLREAMAQSRSAIATGLVTSKQDENTDFTDDGHGFHR
jgi:hypothetical protein